MAGRPRHSDDQRAAAVAAILHGVSAPKAAEAAARGELGDPFTVLGSSVRRWRRSWRRGARRRIGGFARADAVAAEGVAGAQGEESGEHGLQVQRSPGELPVPGVRGAVMMWPAAGRLGCRVVSMTSLSARVLAKGSRRSSARAPTMEKLGITT